MPDVADNIAPLSADGPAPPVTQDLAQKWLGRLFSHSLRRPWFQRMLRPIVRYAIWNHASGILDGPQANARWLLGEESTPEERRRFAMDVVMNFLDFVNAMGSSLHQSKDRIYERIDKVTGVDAWHEARSAKRGAIMVTAHMGCFEIALAGICKHEKHVHVVFQHDDYDDFNTLRAKQRKRWGAIDAPIGEDFSVWMRLRDALNDDHIVLIQGDRVMPGQHGIDMPFAGGRVAMPTGPVKLALAAGSPIIPAFALFRGSRFSGTVDIHMEKPIHPQAGPVNENHPAMKEITAAIEQRVLADPDQWYTLYRTFRKDTAPGEPNGDSEE